MHAVISEVNDYQRDLLPPVTAQPSFHASVVASILEQHTAELTAAQEWENEWNSQGLLSRLTPQVPSDSQSEEFWDQTRNNREIEKLDVIKCLKSRAPGHVWVWRPQLVTKLLSLTCPSNFSL